MKKFPTTIENGLSRWNVEVNQPEHFRAVRRFSPANASTDEKALLVFGLLFLVGGTLFAVVAAFGLVDTLKRLVQFGSHPAALREGLVRLGVVVGWAGLLYLLLPKFRLLEARPGFLRFGRSTWQTSQIARLEIHTINRRRTEMGQADFLPFESHTVSMLEIVVVQKSGRRQTVWQQSGRQKRRAAIWARQMAQVAGVDEIVEQ